jgi:hypothetical protein
VRAILKGREFHALAMDASNGKKFGIEDLALLLCQLASLGCPVTWSEWESQEDPPSPLKMRIPVTGANYRPPTIGIHSNSEQAAFRQPDFHCSDDCNGQRDSVQGSTVLFRRTG